jgi:hypothetical protein
VQARARGAAGMNPAPLWPAGSGEALAWLFFTTAAAPAEIEVQAFDEAWEELGALAAPVDVRWTEELAHEKRAPAPWVGALMAKGSALEREPQGAGLLGTALGTLLMLLLGLSIPGYVALQVLFALRWRGGWRLAAFLPLALMIPVLAWCAFALVSGSNLWPLPALFLTPLAFLYLLFLGLARRGAVRPA